MSDPVLSLSLCRSLCKQLIPKMATTRPFASAILFLSSPLLGVLASAATAGEAEGLGSGFSKESVVSFVASRVRRSQESLRATSTGLQDPPGINVGSVCFSLERGDRNTYKSLLSFIFFPSFLHAVWCSSFSCKTKLKRDKCVPRLYLFLSTNTHTDYVTGSLNIWHLYNTSPVFLLFIAACIHPLDNHVY